VQRTTALFKGHLRALSCTCESFPTVAAATFEWRFRLRRRSWSRLVGADHPDVDLAPVNPGPRLGSRRARPAKRFQRGAGSRDARELADARRGCCPTQGIRGYGDDARTVRRGAEGARSRRRAGPQARFPPATHAQKEAAMTAKLAIVTESGAEIDVPLNKLMLRWRCAPCSASPRSSRRLVPERSAMWATRPWHAHSSSSMVRLRGRWRLTSVVCCPG